MKILVSGSRNFNDYELLSKKLDDYRITEIIHGAARGTDTLAGRYGEEHGIPVTAYPADWELYGKSAGPIRNATMLKEGDPDVVIAFLAKDSRGTQNMIDQALKAMVPVVVVNI